MHWLGCIAVMLMLVGCASTPAELMEYRSGSGSGLNDDSLKRSLQLEMEVEALRPATQSVQHWVENAGGYVQSQYYPTRDRAQVVCHVPANQRIQFINQIKSLGVLQNEAMQAEDLSGEMINLDAELKNLYQLRARLNLLLEKANKVEDILSVERELNRIQTRIDYLEKTERAQKKSIQYTSYALTLNEKKAETVYGPLGMLVYGTYWVVEKLFVIR